MGAGRGEEKGEGHPPQPCECYGSVPLPPSGPGPRPEMTWNAEGSCSRPGATRAEGTRSFERGTHSLALAGSRLTRERLPQSRSPLLVSQARATQLAI